MKFYENLFQNQRTKGSQTYKGKESKPGEKCCSPTPPPPPHAYILISKLASLGFHILKSLQPVLMNHHAFTNFGVINRVVKI